MKVYIRIKPIKEVLKENDGLGNRLTLDYNADLAPGDRVTVVRATGEVATLYQVPTLYQGKEEKR